MTTAVAPFLIMAKPAGAVCNLDCRYCYYLRKTELFPAGERFRMSDETLEAYVRSFIESSPGPEAHFVWHGGEPTLLGVDFYRRAVELQRRHARPGITIINNLQTNGVALDDEWCAFLAAERFHVGLSIDGPASTHDACRADRSGRPTHTRVMRAFRLLGRHGIEPDVLCTLNAVTAREPSGVYRFFLDQGARWLQFLPVVQRGEDGVSEWSVAPELLGGFLCAVFDEWVRHDVGRIAVQTFEDAMRVAMGQPASLCTVSETCGRMLAMEHDGGVYACDHFVDAEHRIGDVASDSLAELVDAPRQVAFGDAKSPRRLPRYCRECRVLAYCNGGCPKDRFATTADGEPGLNYLCAGYRRFYQHVAPYTARIAAIVRGGGAASSIMAELRAQEAADDAPWRAASRNDPCPCGSGRKYKQCCLGRRR